MSVINNKLADTFIAYAVMMQSLLVVIQQLLIAVFQMPTESTTMYRVVLTAVPLSIAILISLNRRWPLFLVTYTITMIILLFNNIIFPQNATFLWHDSLRFLLPTVIPSALCLTCVSNINVVEKALYNISWVVVVGMVVYVISYFNGLFSFSHYNMSLSYGLLLPTLSLFSKKRWFSVLAALFLFIIIISLGSRGAAIVFVVYVCYDTLFSKSRDRFMIIAFGLLFIFLLPLLTELLNDIGIQSRTLSLLETDNIMYSSGRDAIYERMYDVLFDNAIFGIGLWGDRAILGVYCHNILLEIYINWGIIGATIIIIVLLYKLIRIYFLSDKINKTLIVKYCLGLVIPLMASSSYLISYNFGAFIGIIVLLSRDKRLQKTKMER